MIRAKIGVAKPACGCEVLTAPTDAQARHEAMGAVINATHAVVSEMKVALKRKS